MYGPNYKDFYQKALVPIGANDLLCLKEIPSCDLQAHSHWLIALEGNQKKPEVEYYFWQVTIYPADENGSFSWSSPYYSSSIYDSIHLAYEHAYTLEKYSKSDQLHCAKLRERIS